MCLNELSLKKEANKKQKQRLATRKKQWNKKEEDQSPARAKTNRTPRITRNSSTGILAEEKKFRKNSGLLMHEEGDKAADTKRGQSTTFISLFIDKATSQHGSRKKGTANSREATV